MFVQPFDGEWHAVVDAVAPIRFARFMAGFAAVLAAMAVVGAVLYLAVLALAGTVSFGENLAFGETDLSTAVAWVTGT